MLNRQQMIEDNMKLVYAVIHKRFPTFIKDEDIVQHGMIGLCKAANRWSEDKGQFSTYAYKSIVNEINNEFRNRSKHNNILSLDYEVSDGDGDTTTFGDFVVGDEDVEYVDMDSIYRMLDYNEQTVLELKMSGKSTQEIMDATGYTRSMVRKTIRKAKILLRGME